eukprot:243101_1
MLNKAFKLHDVVVLKIDDSKYPCITRRYLKARITKLTNTKAEFITQEYIIINSDLHKIDTVICTRQYNKKSKHRTIVDIIPFESFVTPNADTLFDDVKIRKYKEKFRYSDHRWAISHHFDNQIPYKLPYIYRISGDYTITHGGSCVETFLHFPIWICHKLNVNNDILNNLIYELKTIGKQNNDWRNKAPILNIIDPELYTFRLKRNIFAKELLQLFDKARKDCFCAVDVDLYDTLLNNNKVVTKEELKENITECSGDYMDDEDEKLFYQYELFRRINLPKFVASGKFIRGSYQFLATEFIEINDKIKIISPIHNLPPKYKCKKLYKAIEHIFQCMLPLFNKFKQFKDRKNKQFQCIVKSQSYILNPNSGYSGEWHQEGLTENIILTGLYYWEYDGGLTGGNLKFRNKKIPGQLSDFNEKYLCYKEVSLGKGKAIVFDNDELVHRLRMLKNLTDLKNQSKSFLAFFIVDPEKPINSTKTYPSLKREYFVRLLGKLLLKYRIGLDICALICVYGNNGMTLEFAKKFRQHSIHLKKQMKGKFGHICFGNAGQNVYFPQGKMVPFMISEPYGTYECNYVASNQFVPTTHSELAQSQSQ